MSKHPLKQPLLPDGWAEVSLRDILEVNYGKGLTESQRDNQGNIPVYGSSGIVGYHTAALIQSPAIIIGRKGSVGAAYLSNEPSWPIDTTYFTNPSKELFASYVFYAL